MKNKYFLYIFDNPINACFFNKKYTNRRLTQIVNSTFLIEKTTIKIIGVQNQSSIHFGYSL